MNNEWTSHPFMDYITSLNSIECYKYKLLARNPQMVQLMGTPEYHRLYNDFVEKFPEEEAQLRQEAYEKADCILC